MLLKCAYLMFYVYGIYNNVTDEIIDGISTKKICIDSVFSCFYSYMAFVAFDNEKCFLLTPLRLIEHVARPVYGAVGKTFLFTRIINHVTIQQIS